MIKCLVLYSLTVLLWYLRVHHPCKIDCPPILLSPLQRFLFFNLWRVFTHRKFSICQINSFRGLRFESFQSTQTNRNYDIESFITCSTEYVVTWFSALVLNNILNAYQCNIVNLGNIICQGTMRSTMIPRVLFLLRWRKRHLIGEGLTWWSLFLDLRLVGFFTWNLMPLLAWMSIET